MKRRPLIIATFSFAFAGVWAAIVWFGPREPAFEGKRLSTCLRELEREVQVQDGRLSRTTQVARAIQQIGTKACPTLLAMLSSKDSPLKRRLVELAHKQSIVRFDVLTSDRLRARALYAFVVLGPQAEPAVPSVTAFLRDEDPGIRCAAANVLPFIDPGGEKCVAGLIRALRDPSAEVRRSAAVALRGIDVHTKSSEFEATGVIPESRLSAARPALKILLNDPDLSVRVSAAIALQQIGTGSAE